MNYVNPNSLPDSTVFHWAHLASWAVWIVVLVVIAAFAIRWRDYLVKWGFLSGGFLVIAGAAQIVFSCLLSPS